MTPEERADLCRRIAPLGGKAVVAIHGHSHMSTIGKAGFAKAIELGWGVELSRKLSPLYEAKYGRPIVLSPASQEKARLRAEARKLFGGTCCDKCGAPGQVHHMEGLEIPDPNEPSCIRVLCDAHHRQEHRAKRIAHLRRPR